MPTDKNTGFLDGLSEFIEKGMVQAAADHLYGTVKIPRGGRLKQAQTKLFDRCLARMSGDLYLLHGQKFFWMETGFMTNAGLLSYMPRTLVQEAVANLWDTKFSPHDDKKTLLITDIQDRLLKIADAVKKVNNEELTNAFVEGFHGLPVSTQQNIFDTALAQGQSAILPAVPIRPDEEGEPPFPDFPAQGD